MQRFAAIFFGLAACGGPVIEGTNTEASASSSGASETGSDGPGTSEPDTDNPDPTTGPDPSTEGPSSDATSTETTADPSDTGDTTATDTSDTTATTSDEPPVCGDGKLGDDEECDDGGTADGDGCSASCVKEFRRVFVTGAVFGSDLGGLDGADGKCQAAAESAGLPGDFRAWLSAAGETPTSRFLHSSVPYVRVDGMEVAADWADLVDGNLSSAISLSESGGTPGVGIHPCMPSEAAVVWTNTKEAGAAVDPGASCDDWAGASGDTTWGRAGTTNSAWTGFCSGGCTGAEAALYCFEQ